MKKKFTLGMLEVLAISALVISLMSCGGGGSSSDTSFGESSSSGTGTVAFLLADAPTDDYERIWITITEVSLIPVDHNGTPVVIFKKADGLRIDLLEYRDEDYLLTIKEGIPVGLYAKIRLAINDIEVEPKAGAACSNLEIKLPRGKIDLNPREPFLVSPGGKLSIRLDIDANKSINLHKAGKSGKCIFRPVVFVDIKEGIPIGRCPKILRGTIDQLITDNGQNIGFYLRLANDRGTIKVNLSRNTAIFDTQGDFVNAGSLEVGQEVKVRGKFDSTGALVASLVVIGDVLDITGLVAAAVDTSTYTFPLTAATGQEIVGSVEVKVDPVNTLILIGCDTEVGWEYIQAGMKARVFGKLDMQSGNLKAVAILFCDRVIEGEIINASDKDGGKLVSVNENGSAIEVFIPAGTPVYLEGDGAVPLSLICQGRQVRIFVKWPWIANPLIADLVKVQSEKHEGEITAIDSVSRLLTIGLAGGGSEEVYVEPGATILESNNGIQGLKQFADLNVGDYVIYFGLSACQVGDPFHAFVLVVNPD
ncbi:MAG: DUF4382 domain-containing protein [Thermodesulfobacteriota bacterium]